MLTQLLNEMLSKARGVSVQPFKYFCPFDTDQSTSSLIDSSNSCQIFETSVPWGRHPKKDPISTLGK